MKEERIQRSLLILPVHVPRFVEKAHLRGADAVLLDLEDAVPPAEKDRARELVRDAALLAGRGGADVLVRVNNDPRLLEADLESAIHPGLHGVFMPKVETARQVKELETLVAELETTRALAPGSVTLSLHVESPLGVLNLHEIAAASPRTESMSMGVDDYCLELGVRPSEEGTELFFAYSMLVNACRAYGVLPMGVLGSVADFSDLDGFGRAAERARKLGFTGGYCVHPGQVAVLNRVFCPTTEETEQARRIKDAFEKGLEDGLAAVNLDGRMVDTPIYKQAMRIVRRAEAVEQKEAKKSEALARLEET